MAVTIAKADGTQEPYEERKLISSLMRAGAEEKAAHAIAQSLQHRLYDGITTQEIYRAAFARLREHRRVVAARYSLKRAILEFGPSGFPFESYVAELFRAEGNECSVDQIVQGACVEHEVDIVIKKGTATMYAEAKFHNTPGFKTDLKTVLYVKARIDDLRAAHNGSEVRGLVVTNTKFTDHATRYASCQGLDLLGWDYPSEDSLHERIDRVGLYPITALTSLTRREKMALLESRIVLCRSLKDDTRALSALGITGRRAESVLEESGALCARGEGR